MCKLAINAVVLQRGDVGLGGKRSMGIGLYKDRWWSGWIWKILLRRIDALQKEVDDFYNFN